MVIKWPILSIGRRLTEVVSGLIQIGVGVGIAPELFHELAFIASHGSSGVNYGVNYGGNRSFSPHPGLIGRMMQPWRHPSFIASG